MSWRLLVIIYANAGMHIPDVVHWIGSLSTLVLAAVRLRPVHTERVLMPW